MRVADNADKRKCEESELLEEYNKTFYVDYQAGKTSQVKLLKIFDESEWEKLFWFIDQYVSCIRGRYAFDHIVTQTKDVSAGFGKLFSVSDLVFCLNTLDNSYPVWSELAEYKKNDEERPAKLKNKAKFTNGEHNSVVLRNEYTKRRKQVADSLKFLDDRESFFNAMFEYLKRRVQERKDARKNADSNKPKPAGTEKEKPKCPEPEDNVEWDIFCAMGPVAKRPRIEYENDDTVDGLTNVAIGFKNQIGICVVN